MKWKIGDRVAMLSRVNRRRLEPEAVRILTISKVTPQQIVLEDGSRYHIDGSAIGKSLGQIRKATAADEAKIADQVERRKSFVEGMKGQDQERLRLFGLFPADLRPSVTIHPDSIELTFNITSAQAEMIARLLRQRA